MGNELSSYPQACVAEAGELWTPCNCQMSFPPKWKKYVKCGLGKVNISKCPWILPSYVLQHKTKI